jgi:hypothetical protein
MTPAQCRAARGLLDWTQVKALVFLLATSLMVESCAMTRSSITAKRKCSRIAGHSRRGLDRICVGGQSVWANRRRQRSRNGCR